jgi:hypothetical protein
MRLTAEKTNVARLGGVPTTAGGMSLARVERSGTCEALARVFFSAQSRTGGAPLYPYGDAIADPSALGKLLAE